MLQKLSTSPQVNKDLGIAGAVFLAVMGLAFWFHGSARYAAGKASCLAETNARAAEASKEAAKDLENTHNDTQKMSPAAVDADLARLGIMRSDSDR